MEIKTFADLIDMLTAQKANLPTYLVQCNATAADVTEISNELANLTAMDTYCGLFDDNKKTNFGIKQALFDGVIGSPISTIPPNLTAPTLVAAAAGSKGLSQLRNRRFKAGPGYTQAIGQALKLAVDPDIDPIPVEVQPKIDVFAALMGYLFSVVVTGRVASDRWDVLVQPAGSSGWTVIGTATGKSQDFTYHPATAGNPIQLRVMVQLKKNNADYGQPSDVVLVTVNP